MLMGIVLTGPGVISVTTSQLKKRLNSIKY